MSFCIRSATSSGRYVVPKLVAGVTPRRFTSHQLLKHPEIDSTSSSTPINEFLGLSAPFTSSLREDFNLKSVSGESLNNTYVHSSSVQILDNNSSDNVNTPIRIHHLPSSKNYELSAQESSSVPRVENQSIHFNELKSWDRQVLILNHKENLVPASRNTNFTTMGILAKDKTKVEFSIASLNALAVEPNDLDKSSAEKKDAEKKSSNENLEFVYKTLSVDLPKFFTRMMNYQIYHPNIEFINNFKGTQIRGIQSYVTTASLFRMYGHIKFSYVKFDILKITIHTQDNTVRVRWRITGISVWKILFQFWKINIFKLREFLKEQESWMDGFSIFYVGDDGLVYKHVADKMMPDEQAEKIKPKTDIPTKLASQLTFSSLD